jgi:predicted TIM-barrel fold metal-dependent hydrolase
MYTGAELGEKSWRLDDEKVAYPFWERSRKLGIKNLCVHKGLPLGFFNEQACTPGDIEKAALDFPDLNFIIYHSGYRGPWWVPGVSRGRGTRVVDKATTDPQEIPWVSDILRILRKHPKIKNVYLELGSTFDMLSRAAPATCLHMLGQMIQVAGADHILWGTDSIWNGSPQSQIERFRRLKMDENLMKEFKYPELTASVKEQILGLNSARLFGVDPAKAWKAIKTDKLSALREEYLQNPQPTNTQYGWVWIGQEPPTAPVGNA